LERRAKLEQERFRILSETTPQQRVEEMIQFVNALDEFGKKHFNSTINLFLDDLRPYPTGFKIARNVEEAKYYMENCRINILSLDHDLGENVPTGYDLTKWMVENDRWANIIYLHTSNPVGRANMFQLLNRYKPEHVKVYNSPIPNYLLKDEDYL
jgi:hypothetical protein